MMSAAVITLSDKGHAGLRQDTSGPAVAEALAVGGFRVAKQLILPDERALIEASLMELCGSVDLIVTTGGTGLSPRDVAPEATLAVVDRRIPGMAEAMRAASMRVTDRAMLSRAEAGIRGGTLIINLPGSRKAAMENLMAVIGVLGHAIEKIKGSPADCGVEADRRGGGHV